MVRKLAATTVLLLVLGAAAPVAAHCQIPCGIYNDMMRIVMLREHVTTIEKSIAEIEELAGADEPAALNQLVRWVQNKEDHSDLIAEIVTEYFLRQRIKAPIGDDAADRTKYTSQLVALHGVLVTSMKAKQGVDPGVAGKLLELIDEFAGLYFTEEQLKHLQEHHP